MSSQQETGTARAAELYAAGLFLVYAALLLAHHAPPSLTDTANWTYQGVLLREHLLGHPDPFHALKHYPIPNSTATVGIGLLALLLPWQLALKAWLCVQLGFSFAAMRHLLRTLRAGWLGWVVLPQAVFLNVNFWYGFLNFELGIACVLLLASLLLRQVQGSPARARTRGWARSWTREWTVGAVLLLAFFTHMIAFAFCGLLVLLYAAQTRAPRNLWQLVPTAALSVWYLVGRFLFAGNADGQAGMEASVRNYSAAFWAFKANSYLKSFGFINPGSVDYFLMGRALFVSIFAVNVLLAGLMLWAIVRAARTGAARSSEQRFLWFAVLLLVPLFLLAPGAALGISDPGARLLQVALALALALAANRLPPRGRAFAAACVLVLTLTGLLLFSRVAFDFAYKAGKFAALPVRLVEFAHVPNDDQDYFYGALDAGDLRKPVFPTGLFLNKRVEPPATLPDGSTHSP